MHAPVTVIVLSLVLCFNLQAQQLEKRPPESANPLASSSSQKALTRHRSLASPGRSAWSLLYSACTGGKDGERAHAISALGLLPHSGKAVRLAEKALKDDKAEVRSAAAQALGNMRARESAPALVKALDDAEPTVALAAAHSLIQLHDAAGYEVYYEILTHQRRAGKGLIPSELDTLRDPKKLAMLGFEEGIGFIPFASIGWSAYKELHKDDSAQVRVLAATILAGNPDRATTDALVAATTDSNWLVRVAALESLARRGDDSALKTTEASMQDSKSEVRFTAAAATIRLSAIQRSRYLRERKHRDMKSSSS